MTFIPLGIWEGAPGLSVGLYIWKGIIPTLIGNILGGGLFCVSGSKIPKSHESRVTGSETDIEASASRSD
ncbi:Formate/nitrite transporter [Penicillium citrinum]|uniref:Formate/nitrite transporter n=1 Tax=Penicillium citrinum TaxID=5077 RepID=A0A9W9PI93_PENCI|nr:Formate/nitrite transporter [Penicillium citrinum]KAJ5243523.1 Formate/nitrite transporter [Penicillium citrinum]